MVKGSDYTAVRRISDANDRTLAAPGESCDRVPATAIAGLLASGDIVLAPDAALDDAGRRSARRTKKVTDA